MAVTDPGNVTPQEHTKPNVALKASAEPNSVPPGELNVTSQASAQPNSVPPGGPNVASQASAEPNVARMYDYLLGGTDNLPVDREAADRMLAVLPGVRVDARENRAFLGRAVRFLAGQGIRQFLDIGSGLPTRRSTHEVAARAAAGCRTVYVDNDPEVVSHAGALLRDVSGTRAVLGDLRRPQEILGNPGVRTLLDLDRPVAVLLLSIAHVAADDPRPVVAALMAPLPSGSHLVLSHVSTDPRAESVAALFDGLELVPPGVVTLPEWRPRPLAGARTPHFLCGVARKP